MLLKSILNRVEKFPGFVIKEARWRNESQSAIDIVMRPRKNSWPICSRCGKIAPGYDQTRTRRFDYVPLWQIPVQLVYTMRRVNCWQCEAVTTERVPWAEGKQTSTKTFQWFLAEWAKRLSWEEVATVFGTSWRKVCAAVEHAVEWGRAHIDLREVTAIGVDEILHRRGTRIPGGSPRFMTLVYQIDQKCKRLLWIGRDRTDESFQGFFNWLGNERSAALRFVCSDMWQPYLKVIRQRVPQAIHILDRFHIVAKMNKALDAIRATEVRELKRKKKTPVLTNARWILLKRRENLSEAQQEKLSDLLSMNLRVVRSYLLKEGFQRFWTYTSPFWAGKFLDSWCTRATRSRIHPMKQIAKSLRRHRPLLLNWFAAKAISVGAVEGLNNKAKVTMRKSYGYRTYRIAELALYQSLGKLPTPEFTHTFW